MKGGMVNADSFENFKKDVLNHNDNLKRQERQMNAWWNNLKQMLETVAEYQIFNEVDTNTYTVDLVNVLGIIIAKKYLTLQMELYQVEEIPRYIFLDQRYDFIHKLNENTINLPVKLNQEYVEFIQILINHIKSTEYYAELNVYNAIELGIDTLQTNQQIEGHILNLGDGHLDMIYKHYFRNVVKILSNFVNLSYLKRYGNVAYSQFDCSLLWFNHKEDEEQLKEFKELWDIDPDKALRSNILNEAWQPPNSKVIKYREDRLTELITRNYSRIRNNHRRRREFSKNLLSAVGVLRDELFDRYILNNSDRMTYPLRIKLMDQQYVRNILFFRKILHKFINSKYNTLEEYYKNESKPLDDALADILECINSVMEEYKKQVSFGGENGALYAPTTRLFHLYPLEEGDFDNYIDSDEELENLEELERQADNEQMYIDPTSMDYGINERILFKLGEYIEDYKKAYREGRSITTLSDINPYAKSVHINNRIGKHWSRGMDPGEIHDKMENEDLKIKEKDFAHMQNDPYLAPEYYQYAKYVKSLNLDDADLDKKKIESSYIHTEAPEEDYPKTFDHKKRKYKSKLLKYKPSELEKQWFQKIGFEYPEGSRAITSIDWETIPEDNRRIRIERNIQQRFNDYQNSIRRRGQTPLQRQHELRSSILSIDPNRTGNIGRRLDEQRDRVLTRRRDRRNRRTIGRVRRRNEPLVSPDSSSDPYGVSRLFG